MSAVMSDVVAQLIADLDARSAFVAAQASCGMPMDALLEQQGEAFMVYARSLRHGLSPADGARVTTAIGTGPWTASAKLAMVSVVGDLCRRSVPQRGNGARSQQKCATIELLFAIEDYQVWRDSAVGSKPKLLRMARRMARLGIRCPCEKLLQRCIAILICVGGGEFEDPTPKKMQTFCRALKDLIKQIDTVNPYPFPHLAVYPPSYEDLPAAVRNYAYEDGATIPPSMDGIIDTIRLEEVFVSTCYRSTHRSLRKDKDGTPHDDSQMGSMLQIVQRALQPLLAARGHTGDCDGLPGFKLLGQRSRESIGDLDLRSPRGGADVGERHAQSPPATPSLPALRDGAAESNGPSSRETREQTDPMALLEARIAALDAKGKRKGGSDRVVKAKKATKGMAATAKAKAKSQSKAGAKAKAQPNTTTTAKSQPKAVAKAKAQPKATAKATSRPKAAATQNAATQRKAGCSKCRYHATGCSACSKAKRVKLEKQRAQLA